MIKKYQPIGLNSVKLAKIPKEQEKYSNIKSQIKSGQTVKDVRVISNNFLVKRQNEYFSRIKADNLKQILEQEVECESIYNISKPQEQQNNDDVISVSQVTLADAKGYFDEFSFILLDMRTAEAYAQYHIKDALNLPQISINQDKFIPELYQFKNKQNKQIIVYGFDEKEGIPCAKMLYQKGFNNIYLLNEGIEKFSEIYPKLIVGKLPETLKKSNIEQKKTIYKKSDKENINIQQYNGSNSQQQQKNNKKVIIKK